MKVFFVIFLGLCWWRASALNNGLVKTPPMGWMSWERFRCETDCKKYPNECINEKLMRDMADRMAEGGYLKAGYEYLIIDDCWLAKTRDAEGRLQHDPERFPSGMKNLGDYIHSKGLKFGLYEDYGNKTCAGYPGMIDNLKGDAELFASFGVDYAKIDGCFSDPEDMDEGYTELGKYFLETKRPIVYSCSWPYYQQNANLTPNYDLIEENCNLWRNYEDIEDSWASVMNIINHFAENQDVFAAHAGPGHWNDPDMLIIGNFGLSYDQAKAQMAIWSVLAAPLIMSNDLRDIKPEFRDILLNKGAIAINQDRLGIQGKRQYEKKKIEVWTKPIEPVYGNEYSYGVAILSKREDGSRRTFTVDLDSIGLNGNKTYIFTEVFNATEPFEAGPGKELEVRIPPTSAFLFKAVLKRENQE